MEPGWSLCSPVRRRPRQHSSFRRPINPRNESLHCLGRRVDRPGEFKVVKPLQRTCIDQRPVRQRGDSRWPRMLGARFEYRDARAARRHEVGIEQQSFKKLQVHQVVSAVVDLRFFEHGSYCVSFCAICQGMVMQGTATAAGTPTRPSASEVRVSNWSALPASTEETSIGTVAKARPR